MSCREPETSFDEAKEALKKALEGIEGTVPGTKVDIVTWGWKHAGPRISEISFYREHDGKTYGTSYLQSNPRVAHILFAAERFILDTMLGEEHGGLPEMYLSYLNKYLKGEYDEL
jgi:hypothetical protein